jgi:hypothetical protein
MSSPHLEHICGAHIYEEIFDTIRGAAGWRRLTLKVHVTAGY